RLLIFLLLYKDDIRCVRYLELLKKIKPELAEEISVFAVGAREYGIDIGEGGITVKGPLDDLPNTKSNDLIKEAFNFCQIGQYEKGSVLLKERLADKTITHEEKAVLNYALGLSFLYKPYINLDGKELFNNSQGLDYLKEAIKLCPNINEFRRGLIFAYIELEKYPEALEEIKVLLERKPDDKYALYSQGYIYFSTKEWGKAVESWGKLRNIDNILFALIQYEYEQAKQSMK
ncbi:MAG: hypothetical protein KKE64_07535, partial [Candidatus Omnitrophica bacterium]|nr:hypothetical protein [Candidatus Omnitrophota bacterium]